MAGLWVSTSLFFEPWVLFLRPVTPHFRPQPYYFCVCAAPPSPANFKPTQIENEEQSHHYHHQRWYLLAMAKSSHWIQQPEHRRAGLV